MRFSLVPNTEGACGRHFIRTTSTSRKSGARVRSWNVMHNMRQRRAWSESLPVAGWLVAHSACGHGTPTSASPPPSAPATSSVDPLREAALAAGKLVGTAVQSSFLTDSRYSNVLNRHFNYVTAE